MSSAPKLKTNQIDQPFRPPGVYSPEGHLLKDLGVWHTDWEKMRHVNTSFIHAGLICVDTIYVGVDQSGGYAPEPMIFKTEVLSRVPSTKWGHQISDVVFYPNFETASRGHLLVTEKWSNFTHFLKYLWKHHQW